MRPALASVILLLAFVHLQPLTVKAARGGSKADCHLRQVDNCLDTIEAISNDQKSAELLKTVGGLEKLCKASADTSACVSSQFRKCATPTHRELYKFFADHFDHSMNNFCQDGQPRQKFLKESPCIVDKVLKKPEYRKQCVDNYLATLDKTQASTDTTVKINTACCSYNRWEECMYTMINKECGVNARSSMEYFIKKAIGTTSNSICNDASFKYSSKKCTKLYAAPGTKPKGRNSQNPITKYIVAYMGFLFN